MLRIHLKCTCMSAQDAKSENGTQTWYFDSSSPGPTLWKKLIVSGPYLLEISHLVILKLIDASQKRKLF